MNLLFRIMVGAAVVTVVWFVFRGDRSDNVSLPHPVEKGQFTDSRDGKVYNTVIVGSQTWMAENLNYQTEKSWCYDNDESNCEIYGRLYDWNIAMTACPNGWRLPSEAEWLSLINTVGDSTTAGRKLKSQNGWSNDGNGGDNFGFSALPGGGFLDGDFEDIGDYGLWWSSKEAEAGAPDARYWLMHYDTGFILSAWYDKSVGLSVRCVMD